MAAGKTLHNLRDAGRKEEVSEGEICDAGLQYVSVQTPEAKTSREVTRIKTATEKTRLKTGQPVPLKSPPRSVKTQVTEQGRARKRKP